MIDAIWGQLREIAEPSLRLALVLLAGGVVGWERETKGQSAGLRTHTMVGLGAALFAMLSEHVLGDEAVVGDHTRVIAGIAQGIGFLGAGTIIKEDFKVKGLTTAATIWMMGALGIAWGVGEYGLGVVSTIAALIVLRGYKRVESLPRLRNRKPSKKRAEPSSGGKAFLEG